MFGSKREPSDFNAEIQAHIEIEIDRLREQGLDEKAARAAALRTFGNVAGTEERYYESGRWAWLDLLTQNIRFGWRMLARNPASSVMAILTLALAIGANTAIFSLLHAVLLRNLPVSKPAELMLFGKGEWTGSTDRIPDESWQLFSYYGFHVFRERNSAFSDVAAVHSSLFKSHGRVGGATEFENVAVELVSGSFFHTLGVRPSSGRILTDSDDVTPGAHPVAVASASWWRRRLAESPSAVGTSVMIGQTTYTVVGVAQAGFTGANVGQSPDLWIPLAMEKEISPGWNGLENKRFQSLYVIARRKPGVSAATAQANVDVVFRQVLNDMAGPNPTGKQVDSMAHAKVQLTPAATGFSSLRRRVVSPLMVLMAVVALVLLIACANVANLLLARATARRREMAVRMSIGAGRRRLILQLLVESGMLGLAGAVASVPLAGSLLKVLLAGPETASVAVPLNGAVLAFALAVTMLTVFLFGLAPALQATRLNLSSSLTVRGGSGGGSAQMLGRGLIVGQVALSLALLAGAGLFLRSLTNVMNVETGFDAQRVLVTRVDPSAAGYREDARLTAMMQNMEEQVSAIPGVQAASFSFSVFDGGGWTTTVKVPGQASDRSPSVFQNIVGVQFLDVMNTPLLAGRGFTQRDSAAGPKVAVINQALARACFGDVSPIGRTFSIGDDAEWQNLEVVGVVRDGKYMSLDERLQPAAFYPRAQHPGYLDNFLIRYRGDASALIPQIRDAMTAVDRNVPVAEFSPLEKVVGQSVQNRRLLAQLTTLFGVLAALLACIGIYGVMSYGIARRTNELGIRMALGAQQSAVLWMVLRETLSLTAIGIVLGLGLALALSRLVSNMLFGLKPADPLAMGAATAVMVAVAVLSGWIPARRATRIEPTVALRND